MNIELAVTKSSWITLALLTPMLALLFAIYSIGFGGIFFFDDPAAFDGLKHVRDFSSAMLYITTGSAGPFGRPITLATFLLNADAYPDRPSAFFLFNSLLHLCNVVLIAYIVQQLQQLRPDIFTRSTWFAPAVAGFWGILPILASTSMMAVQRMTSLSAFFVLLGVILYLLGRRMIYRNGSALPVITGVWLCTGLAALSKENGALLPLYLLVLEFCLLNKIQRPASIAADKAMTALKWSLLVPSAIILVYLFSRLPGAIEAYQSRPFNLAERLATQTIVLWDYIRIAFLPRPMHLSPFQDDYTIHQFGSPLVWLALAGWISVMILAFWQRNRRPVILFGIGWYLTGHLLESTFLPLHLYFEHRNYLPILGPVILIATGLAQLDIQPSIKWLSSTAYLAFLTIVLWQATSIWGNRDLLYWAELHPNSPRAIHTIAGAYLKAGKLTETIDIYRAAFERNPRLSSVAMQGLRLRCYDSDQATFQDQLNKMTQTLPASHYSNLTLESLAAIQQLHLSGGCPHLDLEDIHRLISSLQMNPGFQTTVATRHLHTIRAETYLSQGSLQPAREEYERAIKMESTLQAVVNLYKLIEHLEGRESAIIFANKALDSVPSSNPWVREQWRKTLRKLSDPTQA